MTLLYALQQLLNAVQVTAIYALLSAAFVLFYGVTNRINLAFGAIAMWAAYVTIMMISILEGMTFWPLLAVVVAGAVIALANTALLGFSLHHLVIRHLVTRRTQTMLIATLALAITLEETMRLINNSRELWLRPIFANPMPLTRLENFPVQITPLQVAAVLIAFGAVFFLILMMKRHRFGIYWRACAEDLHMAALCGSLIGGLRSLTGALIASAALGLFETFWSAYFDLAYRDVAAFCVLTLVLVLKPEGLRAR